MLCAAFSSLVVFVTLAHTAPSGLVRNRPSADTLAFDTTHVVVTPADVAQLTAFLEATTNEWGAPAMRALLTRHTVTYPLVLGDVGGAPIPPQLTPGTRIAIPNYSLVADSVAAVAQGFTRAKLSPRRYMQLARSLNTAWITDQLDRLSHNGTAQGHDSTTVIGKNVAFLRAHMADFTRLLQLALDVTTFQQQRDAMNNGMAPTDDLNP